jgi:hypothetical protein
MMQSLQGRTFAAFPGIPSHGAALTTGAPNTVNPAASTPAVAAMIDFLISCFLPVDFLAITLRR